MKHKNFAIVLILLGQSIAPICDAQFNLYTKLKRGQPCPFDSCVATELIQWRRESAFINTLRSENNSLRLETESLQSEINLADSMVETYKSELMVTQRAIMRKDSINQIIASNLTNIHTIATDALKPKRWYQRPEIWGGVGFILGLIIAR